MRGSFPEAAAALLAQSPDAGEDGCDSGTGGEIFSFEDLPALLIAVRGGSDGGPLLESAVQASGPMEGDALRSRTKAGSAHVSQAAESPAQQCGVSISV